MPSWTEDVINVTVLNSTVNRIELTNRIIVDVPTRLLSLNETERVKVEVKSANVPGPTKGAGVCLCGVVYANIDEFTFVSSGGLLCRLPTTLKCNDLVFVAVNKSRRRRRE